MCVALYVRAAVIRQVIMSARYHIINPWCNIRHFWSRRMEVATIFIIAFLVCFNKAFYNTLLHRCLMGIFHAVFSVCIAQLVSSPEKKVTKPLNACYSPIAATANGSRDKIGKRTAWFSGSCSLTQARANLGPETATMLSHSRL